MFIETTPDTSGYMIAGFAVAFITMGIYVISLYIRSRNLKQDIETLESMQVEKPKSQK
jgi:cell division protein FtsL